MQTQARRSLFHPFEIVCSPDSLTQAISECKRQGGYGWTSLFFGIECDAAVSGELFVVPELDHVPGAPARSVRAAQRLGVDRQQILALAYDHIVVIDRRFHCVERKCPGQVLCRQFDPQHPIVLFVDPDRTRVARLIRLALRLNVPVRVRSLHREIVKERGPVHNCRGLFAVETSVGVGRQDIKCRLENSPRVHDPDFSTSTLGGCPLTRIFLYFSVPSSAITSAVTWSSACQEVWLPRATWAAYRVVYCLTT